VKSKYFEAYKQKLATDPLFLENLRSEVEKLKVEIAQLEANNANPSN
jgi:hypothetical protein